MEISFGAPYLRQTLDMHKTLMHVCSNNVIFKIIIKMDMARTQKQE